MAGREPKKGVKPEYELREYGHYISIHGYFDNKFSDIY